MPGAALLAPQGRDIETCGLPHRGSVSLSGAQGLSPAAPGLSVVSSSHPTGWQFGDVIPHQVPSPRFPGRNLGAIELTEDTAGWRDPRGQSSGVAPTPPSGRTHTEATERAATAAPAVTQVEKTPPAPKRASFPFRSHGHQHIPCSTAGTGGGNLFPARTLQPLRDIAFTARTSLS